MSLCETLLLRLFQMKSVRGVVVGAGVVGLSTAVCIAENLPLCSVTLLSEKFSPNTTSDGAAGIVLAAEFPGNTVVAASCCGDGYLHQG
ncbi:hypothetical protein AMECASPLE_039178 [Ameca splendens]|uniref:D-aspartate oxidase n=1 Tax=Ameca splendens TaxID=208324 RepID=A0ABV0YJG6_9TELE